jgi:hypothetical protein
VLLRSPNLDLIHKPSRPGLTWLLLQ